MSDEFATRVHEIVAALEPGELVSYGDVAAQAGHPGAARVVGRLMASSEGLPWWRVVTVTGRLVPGLEVQHAAHLEAEGHTVRGNRLVSGESAIS